MCRAAAAALVLITLAGCGSSTEGSAKATSTRLVNPGKPPLVNSFDVDPADGSFLLTTNKGFFRITKDGKKLTQVRGAVTSGRSSSPVGTFLAVDAVGGGRLLGSGHPDQKGTGLPQFLGFLTSDDAGKSWKVVSRLGLADFHVMRLQFGRIYAYDAVIGGLLVSEDGGRNWTEHPTPRELITDFVVDPEDEDYVLATSEKSLFRSTDRGDSWRPIGPVDGLRLAWPSEKVLVSTDRSGRVQRSEDRGESWKDVGRIDGEPWRLKAMDDKTLFAALSDGTIVKSADGGGEWSVLFRP